MNVLFIHPPVYDFACHDFWLKPYGLLKLAGLFHQKGASVFYFDFLDRFSPDVESRYQKSDAFGKGKWPRTFHPRPDIFQHVPRRFKRYGRHPEIFKHFLQELPPLHAVFITCAMSYWYPGVKEILPYLDGLPVYVGGAYPSLFPEHANSLGIEVVTHHSLPDFLSRFQFSLEEFYQASPYWEGYPYLPYLVIRLSWGCPFRCSYCAVPDFYPRYIMRNWEEAFQEITKSLRPETEHIIFYDDALLMREEILFQFCRKVLTLKKVRFHTPNGLAINQLTEEVAHHFQECHFSQIYLGYETVEDHLQEKIGGKTSSNVFKKVIKALRSSSYPLRNVHAYILMGHDLLPPPSVEKSIKEVLREGIRPLLAEYSPIPGTPDGDRLIKKGMDPLLTNKTSWTYQWSSQKTIRYLKDLAHSR